MQLAVKSFLGNSKEIQTPEFISDHIIINNKNLSDNSQVIHQKLESLSERKNTAENYHITYREQLHSLRRKIISQPEIDWNLTDICRNLNINKGHLQRLYKELFLVSLKDDIIEARISKAKHLLTNTDIRIQEIALRCGYRNTEHFSRQFKEKTAVTPKEYRKKKQPQ